MPGIDGVADHGAILSLKFCWRSGCAVAGVVLSAIKDVLAIIKSSDNDGESRRGRCEGDFPVSLSSLSSAFRRPLLGLVSGSKARRAKSSSVTTPSLPKSDEGSFGDGT